MEQLSGLDASFLYAETPNAPLHIGGVSIFDPSGAGPPTLDEILRTTNERIHLARSRRKVVRVPMDLGHPYWVEDKDFDLEYHIRRTALPQPGDWRELYLLAARILARPLDLSKPPWETYYVEGLDNLDGIPKGCFAVISKTHHCAVDGVSGVEMSELLFDLTPEPRVVEPPEEPWQGEKEPSAGALLARSYMRSLTETARFTQLLTASVPSTRRLMRGMFRREFGPMRPPAPRTRFNRTISPNRVIGFRRFPLREIRAMRAPVDGATVNDVVVALCAGALRRYLASKNELPRVPLVAMAPVNVRTEEEKGTLGNRISAMLISTGSDIEDPGERLAAVCESSSQSKALTRAIGSRTMADAAEVMPGSLVVMAMRLANQMGLANYVNFPFNCVITNVPGPQIPLYSMGARLITSIGYGPVVDGLGLFIAIGSYCGELVISFDACAEMLPDPEFLEECLSASYEDMKSLIQTA